jgi:predicted  nucleic acid-binding Zn-ribbon protein
MKKILLTTASLFMLLLFSGCANNVYYAGMEKVGFHKRDIMVDRVKKVQDSQKDAQEEFKSALEQFGSLVTIKDSNLKDAYEKFNEEYEDVNESAEDLNNKIDKLEDVSLALFEEWEEELALYKNQKLKAQSQENLRDTQTKYKKMMKGMRNSENSMQPILDTFKDNVLILKHSLNAQAIGALQGEFGTLKKEISSLISKMNQSIQSSNIFIKEMK